MSDRGGHSIDPAAVGVTAGHDTILEVEGITKSYGQHRAVDDVTLSVRAGSVHGLVGENGAGKSTLGNILSGVIRPDAGTMRVGGTPVAFSSPADALRAGITIMQQELSLALDLSVQENVLLGMQPSRLGAVSRRASRRMFDEVLARTGFDLDGSVSAGSLPLAKQQEVEIVRALARGARLIVMDEPTSSLGAQDAEKLHAVVRSVRESGVAVVYVSHFLEEVLALSDEVTTMRNSRLVSTVDARATTVETLVAGMLGAGKEASYPARTDVADDAPAVFEVRNLRRPGQSEGIDLTVRAGEVVGLFGLVGSGRSELAHALFGAAGRGVTGEVRVNGVPVTLRRPADALRAGIFLLPESRKDQGLFLGLSQCQNATVSVLRDYSVAGNVRSKVERRAAQTQLSAMGVNPIDLDGTVGVLSGGNQQKVMFAKALLHGPRVLILDEPTRGVDVGARRAIYDVVARLVSEGMAVLLISSEYEEVAHMSHRMCVLREGRIDAEFDAGQATHDRALAAAFGVAPSSDLIKEMT